MAVDSSCREREKRLLWKTGAAHRLRELVQSLAEEGCSWDTAGQMVEKELSSSKVLEVGKLPKEGTGRVQESLL